MGRVIYGLAWMGLGYYSETEPADGFPALTVAAKYENEVLEQNFDNPGALHFTIHSYDQPHHAVQAVDAAYHYLTTSIAIPHAVHMPAHIFSDMGYWNDMVDANTASMNTAYRQEVGTSGDWYHASAFLAYGLLQHAMDCDVASLITSLQSLSKTEPDKFDAVAGVNIPTMFFVETRAWRAAATFDLVSFYSMPHTFWDNNPWALVTSNFISAAAKAVLDYPLDDISASVRAVDAANEALLSDPDWVLHQLPYWRQSFTIMVDSAHAWETFRVESMGEGIVAMQAVVRKQESSWYPEIAHAWDANEQLAEMFLLRKEPGDVESALAAYEHALKSYPNRYRTLAGAGECAETLGDDVKATLYYGKVCNVLVCMIINRSVVRKHQYGVNASLMRTVGCLVMLCYDA